MMITVYKICSISIQLSKVENSSASSVAYVNQNAYPYGFVLTDTDADNDHTKMFLSSTVSIICF